MPTKPFLRPGVSRVAVEVQFAIPQSREPDAAGISAWAEAVVERMGDEPARVDVCVRVVDEAESESLNLGYRQIDKPTNVLSFAADIVLPDTLNLNKILGDIVICDAVVRQEAQAQNKTALDHYAHMVVHGMLHLYGHDHLDQVDADEMEEIEREILERFGIADPYLAP